MHTVGLVKEALAVAKCMGYCIRQEYLGGTMGGRCEFGGQKWIFLDISLGPVDQLDQLLEVLRQEPGVAGYPMSGVLRARLDLREVA